MTLHLNIAYRRTGKDTLFKLVEAGCKIQDANIIPEKTTYLIYASEDAKIPSYRRSITRVSFADAVKVIVCQNLGLIGGFQKYEDVKDMPIGHIRTGTHGQCIRFDTKVTEDEAKYLQTLPRPLIDNKVEALTLRQYYINHAMAKRAEDPDIWARTAYAPYIEMLSKRRDIPDLFSTDTRFTNEVKLAKAQFLHVTTTRIYRSCVPVPPTSEASEHELDTLATNYLFVTDPEEFRKALTLFPQYRDYKLRFMLTS